MIEKIISWLIPVSCIVCGFESKTAVCYDCLGELPWIKKACLTCSSELPLEMNIQQCGECLINPPFSFSVMLFRYELPISSLITQLKFNKKVGYARPLGVLLATEIQKIYRSLRRPLPEVIIPVPLHKHRLRQRGYNQAMEIARPIHKCMRIPIDYKSVQRSLPTAPQTLLTALERQQNLKGAFRIDTSFTFKHVAILDDVVTTASTLSELAKLLKEQGVKEIDAWCLAKAPKK